MIYKEFEQKYLSRGESIPYGPEHLAAAQRIFDLYKNTTYFATRNREHQDMIIEGWAIIIAEECSGSTMADGYKEPEWGTQFMVR